MYIALRKIMCFVSIWESLEVGLHTAVKLEDRSSHVWEIDIYVCYILNNEYLFSFHNVIGVIVQFIQFSCGVC